MKHEEILEKATPARWEIGRYKDDDHITYLALWPESVSEGKKGVPIALFSPDKFRDEGDDANAALVCLARNAYEPMIKALEDARYALVCEGYVSSGSAHECRILETIDNALALARGEK